jgi:hypothetical protein
VTHQCEHGAGYPEGAGDSGDDDADDDVVVVVVVMTVITYSSSR